MLAGLAGKRSVYQTTSLEKECPLLAMFDWKEASEAASLGFLSWGGVSPQAGEISASMGWRADTLDQESETSGSHSVWATGQSVLAAS